MPDPAHLHGSGAVIAITRKLKKSVTAELIALLGEVGGVQSGGSGRFRPGGRQPTPNGSRLRANAEQMSIAESQRERRHCQLFR